MKVLLLILIIPLVLLILEVVIYTTETEANINPKEFDERNYRYIRSCDRYLNPKNHQVVEEEEKHLTCKQLLTEEYPECIDPYLDCGCKGCPNFYGYISNDERLCNVEKNDFNIMSEGICKQCWNQVATKYYEKEKNK